MALNSRILVIEDHHLVRELLSEMMESCGYEVVEALGGDEGIWLYRREPTDLVITDVLMNKNGLEVIRELRSEFPDVKIIAITAHDPDLLSIARELGARLTFEKPFDPEAFLKAVKELLEENS